MNNTPTIKTEEELLSEALRGLKPLVKTDLIQIEQGKLVDLLASAREAGREEERMRIEQFFMEKVPPHGLSLEDGLWLKRLLNEAFGHKN